MLYVKNLPIWERLITGMMAIALAAYGIFGIGTTTAGYVDMAMGVMMLMTAFWASAPCARWSEESSSSRRSVCYTRLVAMRRGKC